ncbi:membrane hypothetical protein [uncultured delta proteobacterium]|uniref:Uncharacterized protein n=1 Tax=uncultured delta proteobacterium TaxID=34034 RepID=A0A212KHD2_9DELT|nr:membrane hypothetical protein [uncultured delta proteobacterium]
MNPAEYFTYLFIYPTTYFALLLLGVALMASGIFRNPAALKSFSITFLIGSAGVLLLTYFPYLFMAYFMEFRYACVAIFLFMTFVFHDSASKLLPKILGCILFAIGAVTSFCSVYLSNRQDTVAILCEAAARLSLPRLYDAVSDNLGKPDGKTVYRIFKMPPSQGRVVIIKSLLAKGYNFDIDEEIFDAKPSRARDEMLQMYIEYMRATPVKQIPRLYLHYAECRKQGDAACMGLLKAFLPANMDAAALHNDYELIETLLKEGADPDAKSGYELDLGNPVATACANGHFNVVKLLLDAGATFEGEVIGDNEWENECRRQAEHPPKLATLPHLRDKQ